jgi:hypothetical protein
VSAVAGAPGSAGFGGASGADADAGQHAATAARSTNDRVMGVP